MSELLTAAVFPVEGGETGTGTGHDPQGLSLIPHLGHNYLCLFIRVDKHPTDIINFTFRQPLGKELIHGYIYFIGINTCGGLKNA